MPRRFVILRFAACAAVALAGSCAPVGPDYEVPSVELPVSYSQGGVEWKRQSPDSLPVPRAWWKLYRDPTLNSLVERSLASNQELAAAAARLRQAREISKQARALYFPAISLGADVERSKFRFRGPGGGSNILDSFSIPVDLDYEIDVWGKVRRQVESASASEEAAGETLNALRLSIAGEVAQTYWALRAVDTDRAVFTRTLEVRDRALELLAKRREAGSISGLDLSRAETEVATAEADRISLDQTRAELTNALAVLAGAPATGFQVAERADLPAPPPVPGTLPSGILRQRPDVRAAERRVAAANADIGVAVTAFYPSFTIRSSTGFDTSIASTLLSSSALVWSIGANATVPITGQKLLRARRDAAIAAHEAASADYRQSVIGALRDVENALQAAAILQRRQAAQDIALDSARRTLDLSAKRFESGLVSFLDVVEAERTRLDSERAANAIRAERLAVSVSLIKAIGGQW